MFSKQLSGLSPRGLAIVIFTLVFGGAGCVVGMLFFQSRKLLIASVGQHVADLARVAVATVDMEAHERLTSPTQDGSPEFRRVLAPLARFHQHQPSIEYAFTVRETGGREFFVLDTAQDPIVLAQQNII
jgi:hypothetical protein